MLGADLSPGAAALARENALRLGATNALRVAEELRKDDRRQFAFHAIRGQSLLGQDKPAEALPDLLDANKIYNNETNVLNSLGKCYSQMGRKTEALAALKASLKLNSKQDDIKKFVEELEK